MLYVKDLNVLSSSLLTAIQANQFPSSESGGLAGLVSSLISCGSAAHNMY